MGILEVLRISSVNYPIPFPPGAWLTHPSACPGPASSSSIYCTSDFIKEWGAVGTPYQEYLLVFLPPRCEFLAVYFASDTKLSMSNVGLGSFITVLDNPEMAIWGLQKPLGEEVVAPW